MNQAQDVSDRSYPPAPWHLSGFLWMGLFKTDFPIQLPEGLRHMFSPRWIVVILVRYLEGTLRYDEFAIGSLVRLGARFGLFSHCIWVNDRCSLLGGRHIWGLPKEMAEFVWEGDMVRITDEKGTVATLLVNRDNGGFPKVWSPVPAIGQLNGEWTFTIARLWARIGRASMRLNEWAARFDFRMGEMPIVSFAAKPFRATMPQPSLLRG